MKQFERHMNTVNACRFCPMCRNTCTAGEAEHRETVTPKGKALTIFTCINGIQTFDNDVAEVMYHCNLCQLCNAVCEGSWDITEIVTEARRKSVAMGIEPKAVRNMKDSIVNQGNPYGLDKANRLNLLQMPKMNDNASLLYFSGCNVSYKHPEILKAMIKIFQVAGENYTVLNEERCCGAYLDIMGYRDDARDVAKKNIEQFIDSKCQILVTSCPHCYYTIKEMYGQWGVQLPDGLRILHTSSYLREIIAQDKVRLTPLKATLTYHDPCRLGRYCGIYEEPREIIKSFNGIDFKEMRWNRSNARCCGYGSGMSVINQNTARKVAKQRISEIKETGVELLITSCPSCKNAFTENMHEVDKQKVMDLAELVAENISQNRNDKT